MDKKIILEKIKKAAQADARKRQDMRYKRAMAFLIKKGFLKANENFESFYFAKLDVQDLIWAGKNVEPRILEVLPAVVARLPKAVRFMNLNRDETNLKNTVQDLLQNKEEGRNFLNMPYRKIKVWMNLRLNDNRTKPADQKKIMKTFRFAPETLRRLQQLKKLKGFKSETDLIEALIAE